MLTVTVALLFGQAGSAFPAYSIKPLSGVTIAGLPAVTGHICVDQFGYLSGSKKVAVINDPVNGFNAGDHYSPGSKLQVRKRSGKAVFVGSPTVWNGGAVHTDSGDKGWWFDFSNVTEPGEYYIFDPSTQKRSPVFHIGADVFSGPLLAATRMFYYQRIGTPIEPKFAQGPWVDEAIFVQDKHMKSVTDKQSVSAERDMSGGWMDAGDTDKYPPFNADVIHPLLYAYRANPRAFTDKTGIPESGNGLPDILDEVKYQIDWLIRCQFEDGSLPVKMGNIDYGGKYPLSQDLRPRYYGPKDSGATIYTCAIFAHAARVYGQFPQWKSYSLALKDRAIKAWTWFETHPRTYKSDTGEIKSGIANRDKGDQDRMQAYAGIHLFALTHGGQFQKAIRENVGASRQLSESIWSPYEAGVAESLIDYLSLPGADSTVVSRIKDQLKKSASNDHFAPPVATDLYRAWMESTNYHWGSNTVRASWGLVSLLAAEHGELDSARKQQLLERAADMLHSFHGVNPFGIVYLTNMGKYGAEYSLSTIYHAKYGDGTPFSHNPPPGYVVGGPNQQFSGKAAEGKPSVEWIKSQPRAKAYADFNLAWPESSWELSEPAIYYQAIYVRLVAQFAK